MMTHTPADITSAEIARPWTDRDGAETLGWYATEAQGLDTIVYTGDTCAVPAMAPRLSVQLYRTCGLYGWTIVDAAGSFVACGQLTHDKVAAQAEARRTLESLTGQSSLLPELVPTRPTVEQGRLF